MYRIFCESYENFIKTFEGENNSRLKIAEPFKLIVNIDQLKKEKECQSEIYKKLSDLVFYMQKNVKKFPRFKAFLWTLSSRDIKGRKYNISSKEELDEQIKLINSFLKLAYWY